MFEKRIEGVFTLADPRGGAICWVGHSLDVWAAAERACRVDGSVRGQWVSAIIEAGGVPIRKYFKAKGLPARSARCEATLRSNRDCKLIKEPSR